MPNDCGPGRAWTEIASSCDKRPLGLPTVARRCSALRSFLGGSAGKLAVTPFTIPNPLFGLNHFPIRGHGHALHECHGLSHCRLPWTDQAAAHRPGLRSPGCGLCGGAPGLDHRLGLPAAGLAGVPDQPDRGPAGGIGPVRKKRVRRLGPLRGISKCTRSPARERATPARACCTIGSLNCCSASWRSGARTGWRSAGPGPAA